MSVIVAFAIWWGVGVAACIAMHWWAGNDLQVDDLPIIGCIAFLGPVVPGYCALRDWAPGGRVLLRGRKRG